MQTYSFIVHLTDDFDDLDLCEKIYDICKDTTVTSDHAGHMQVAFDRDAESLDHAVRTALEQLKSVGVTAEQVTIESETLPLLAP